MTRFDVTEIVEDLYGLRARAGGDPWAGEAGAALAEDPVSAPVLAAAPVGDREPSPPRPLSGWRLVAVWVGCVVGCVAVWVGIGVLVWWVAA